MLQLLYANIECNTMGLIGTIVQQYILCYSLPDSFFGLYPLLRDSRMYWLIVVISTPWLYLLYLIIWWCSGISAFLDQLHLPRIIYTCEKLVYWQFDGRNFNWFWTVGVGHRFSLCYITKNQFWGQCEASWWIDGFGIHNCGNTQKKQSRIFWWKGLRENWLARTTEPPLCSGSRLVLFSPPC